MITIRKSFEFDAGHRVYQHESKCNNIHGHRYKVDIECYAPDGLDKLGRVIDFSVLKSLCGKWIDDNLDHGMILFVDDPLSLNWIHCIGQFSGMKYYLMNKNPTAENIALLLYNTFSELLESYNIVIHSVTVHETPSCSAKSV